MTGQSVVMHGFNAGLLASILNTLALHPAEPSGLLASYTNLLSSPLYHCFLGQETERENGRIEKGSSISSIH